MSEGLGGRFIAGLWVDDLHRGLLWARFGMTIPEKLSESSCQGTVEGFVAPTWSWACQPELVGWVWGVDNLDYTAKFEYIGNEVAVSNPNNPFGRMKMGGRLLLCAKLRNLPAIRRDAAYLGFLFPHVLSVNGDYIAHLLFDWRHSAAEVPKDEVTGIENIAVDGPVASVSMILIASRSLNSGELANRKMRIKDGNDEAMFGLLLLPVGEIGCYRRVGVLYSETRGLGGRKFWDGIDPRSIGLL